MGMWAVGYTIGTLACYSIVSAQLIFRLPLTYRMTLNPIVGYNWLQYLGTFKAVKYSDMTDWALSPFEKTFICGCFYGMVIWPYRLGVLTREQDARCIILSILVTIKACSIFANRLPVTDIILVLAVFWVMAGCPNACLARIKEISETLNLSSGSLVQKMIDETVEVEVARVNKETLQIRERMQKFESLIDRVGNMQDFCREQLDHLDKVDADEARAIRRTIKSILDILAGTSNQQPDGADESLHNLFPAQIPPTVETPAEEAKIEVSPNLLNQSEEPEVVRAPEVQIIIED